MKKYAHGCVSFVVDALGQEYKPVCGEAWRLAYGVPRNTYMRQLSPEQQFRKSKPVVPRNLMCPGGFGNFNERQIHFIVWLLKCAESVAEKMPIGEGTETQLRLPYPSKKCVHLLYSHFQKFDNSTNLDQCISYPESCKVWKQSPELSHVKLMKSHKEGFAKCDLCKHYERAISGTLSVAQREWWDSKYFNHIAETKKEHAQYYKTKIKAIQKCLLILSIIIDAMDQNKTKIPYFDRPDKCIASEQGLKTKLFAAIVHGFEVYLFWCTALIQTRSNLTIIIIEVLWPTLNKIVAEKRFSPTNSSPAA